MRKQSAQCRTYTDPLYRVTTSFEGVESMTRQDAADAADINSIYARMQNGALPIGSSSQPIYGDFTDGGDYAAALTLINDANMQFMDLPATVRREFDNDPQKWYEATMNEALEKHQAELNEQAEKDAEAKKQRDISLAKKTLGLDDKPKETSE